MSRLVWMLAGLAGGAAFARNSAAMAAPAAGACVLVMIVGCGVCWFAGYRGKSVAVATAVATAVAQANSLAAADAESNAAAIAQAAVQLHLYQAGAGGPAALDGPSAQAVALGAVERRLGLASAAEPEPALPTAPYSLWPKAGSRQ